MIKQETVKGEKRRSRKKMNEMKSQEKQVRGIDQKYGLIELLPPIPKKDTSSEETRGRKKYWCRRSWA